MDDPLSDMGLSGEDLANLRIALRELFAPLSCKVGRTLNVGVSVTDEVSKSTARVYKFKIEAIPMETLPGMGLLRNVTAANVRPVTSEELGR
jgi:hypothetical protein